MNLFYNSAEEAEHGPHAMWADRRKQCSRSTRIFRILKSGILFICDLKDRLKT